MSLSLVLKTRGAELRRLFLFVLPDWTYTLFLFVKSDIKTTLVPITIFAIATSPRTYPLDIHLLSRLPVAVFWLALHLFQCTLANQYIPTGIAEDKLNKPERPIPSGRISAKNTKRIRWVVSLCCLVISTMYGRIVTSASAALTLFIYVYNEKGLSAHWAARNFMNGVAFAAFETGTTAVAGIGCGKQVCPGGSTDAPLDDIAIYAICVSASAFGTTIFAQDFKDIDGDALIGRRTVPMLMSDTNGRILLFVLMTSWSSYLVHFWQLGITTAVAYIGCSTLVCTRFLCWRGVKEDQISFYLYNVWLTFTHALPAYYRLTKATRSL